MQPFETIEAYISTFPKNIQQLLIKIRDVIHDVAPTAAPCIKYGMPTFYLNGNLIHFAAWKNHIGIYPAPDAIKHFNKELLKYVSSKGAIQIPTDQPLPVDLIKKIVAFRIQQNELRSFTKKKTAPVTSDWMAGLSAPAIRALQNAGITTLKKLSSFTENAILQLHGIGPSSIPVLKKALRLQNRTFKK